MADVSARLGVSTHTPVPRSARDGACEKVEKLHLEAEVLFTKTSKISNNCSTTTDSKTSNFVLRSDYMIVVNNCYKRIAC